MTIFRGKGTLKFTDGRELECSDFREYTSDEIADAEARVAARIAAINRRGVFGKLSLGSILYNVNEAFGKFAVDFEADGEQFSLAQERTKTFGAPKFFFTTGDKNALPPADNTDRRWMKLNVNEAYGKAFGVSPGTAELAALLGVDKELLEQPLAPGYSNTEKAMAAQLEREEWLNGAQTFLERPTWSAVEQWLSKSVPANPKLKLSVVRVRTAIAAWGDA
jgi:hypothetical protein